MEGVVFNALYKIGAISPLNYLSREPKKLKWCRSSRTDKGVHATATIVSLNALFETDEEFDPETRHCSSLVKRLNGVLPNSIRAHSCMRQELISCPKGMQLPPVQFFIPYNVVACDGLMGTSCKICMPF